MSETTTVDAEECVFDPQCEECTFSADHPFHRLTTPEGQADPYPTYRELLRRPILMAALGDTRYAVVSRYADCVAVLGHPQVSSDNRKTSGFTDLLTSGTVPQERVAMVQRRSFLHLDPPDHTRLRRLVGKAFTPRRVGELREQVQRLVDAAIDGAADRGAMDVVADLAFPLPVRVICGLLGVPAEDHLRLEDWARPQLCCNFQAQADGRGCQVQEDLEAYFERQVAEKRRHPGDDLLSELIAVRDKGDKLTDDELIATARLLFVGGHETTVALIANGMLALLRSPDQLALLRIDPGLVAGGVEETVRYDPPFQLVGRTPVQDIDVNGTTISRDTSVVVLLAAANRDPAQFVDPDKFDITRHPNRHLGFGSGVHACLGGPLAKMQGEVALGTLVRRLVDPQLVTDQPPYHDNAVHALKALPISFRSVLPA
jgi:cytochrome P450